MGLIERIKSALGLGTSASSPSGPSSTPDRAGEETDDAEPTPVSEVEGDDQVEAAQTVVDPGDGGSGVDSDSDADDVDVTVEHEPDTDSEEAVKSPDAAATGTDADVEPADGGNEADDATAGSEDGTGTSDDADTAEDPRAGVALEEVKGIGPAYADRLRDAGVEDVAALAAADAADLADRTDLGEGRVQKWIDRAQAR